VAEVGEGGLQQVLDTIAAPATLLRLAGEARVPLAAPEGVSVVERVVYRAVPQPLSDEAGTALGRGAVALLHSGEAARAFANECDRLGVDRANVALAALAPRVAQAAGSGWRAVAVAPAVADSALLALAADMCQ
jgi:uroporphyrinogen-III synthase